MKTMFRPFRQTLLLALALGFVAPVLAQSRKVDQQDLYRYWILLNTKVQMDAPNSGLNLDKPGCAAVTYTIGSDGVPMDVQVVKVVPKSDLGPVARSAVSHFRYGPSLGNRIGVYLLSVDHVHARSTLQLQCERSELDALMHAVMRGLPRAEFGRVDLLSTLQSAATSLLLLGMDLASTRLYADLDDEDRGRLFPTWLAMSGGLVLPLLVGLVVAARPLSRALFDHGSYAVAIGLTGLAVLASTIQLVTLSALRNQRRPIAFAVASLESVLTQSEPTRSR